MMDPIYGRCWSGLTQAPPYLPPPPPQLGTLFHTLFLAEDKSGCWNASFWLSTPPQVYVLKGLLFQEDKAESLPTLNSRRSVLTLLKENITFNPAFNTTFNHFFSLSRSSKTKQKRDSYFHNLFLAEDKGGCWNTSFWLSSPPQVYVLKGLLFQENEAQSSPPLNSQGPVLPLLKENITFNPVFNTTFNHFFSPSRSSETMQKRDSYKIITSQKKTLLFTPRDFPRSPSPFSPLDSLHKPILIASNLNLPPVQPRNIGDLFPRLFNPSLFNHSLFNHSLWATAYDPCKTVAGIKTKPGSPIPHILDRTPLGDSYDNPFKNVVKHHRETPTNGVAYLPKNHYPMLNSQSPWNTLLKINFDSLALKPFNPQTPLWLPAQVYNQVQSIFTDKMVNTPHRHHSDINIDSTPPHYILQEMKKVIQNTSRNYRTPQPTPKKEFLATTRDQMQMMTHITAGLKDINRKIDSLYTQQSMTHSRMQTNPHAKDGGFYDY